jgi:hypothetical protein
MRPAATTRATKDVGHLLDQQFNLGTGPFVVKDLDVFQAHQGLDDLIRLGQDEGASCFLAHTSSLKRLRPTLGDPG